MYRRLVLVSFSALWFSLPAAANNLSVDLSVQPTAKAGLERDIVLRIRDASGVLLKDAAVVVSVDMPSMPMAHHVPKTTAKPGAEAGVYIARVTFEMPGEWAARIEVSKPVRASAVRKFVVR